MKENLKKEIIAIIKKVTEQDVLQRKELDIDSLMLMEVVVALEKKYGIKINEGDLSELVSLEGIVLYPGIKQQAL
jgi:acyl carrier protein